MRHKIEGESAWTRLLRRYAFGRTLCNCREAYAGKVSCWVNGREGICWGCPNGCSSNQIDARNDIAKKVIFDLENAQ